MSRNSLSPSGQSEEISIGWLHTLLHVLSPSADIVIHHVGEESLPPVQFHYNAAHLLSKICDILTALQPSDEVRQQLSASHLLNIQCDLNGLVQEVCHLLEVLLSETTRGQGGRANAGTARAHCAAVAIDAVLVERDAHLVAQLLKLGAGQAEGAQVPQHEVVVTAASGHDVTVADKAGSQGTAVCDHLRYSG